jgi:hypothetical protein
MDAQQWWLNNLTASNTTEPATLFYSFADARWYAIGADGTWTPMATPSWDARQRRASDEPLVSADVAAYLEAQFNR